MLCCLQNGRWKGTQLTSVPKSREISTTVVGAVKLHRKDFDGATPTSLLCSRHFTEDCYIIEGQRYRDECGIPAQKRYAVPTIFPKPNDQLSTSDSSCSSTVPQSRPFSERREQRAVS